MRRDQKETTEEIRLPQRQVRSDISPILIETNTTRINIYFERALHSSTPRDGVDVISMQMDG